MIEIIKKHLETFSTDIKIFIPGFIWSSYLIDYPPKNEKEALFLSLLHWKSNYLCDKKSFYVPGLVDMGSESCACCIYTINNENFCLLSRVHILYPYCGQANNCCNGFWWKVQTTNYNSFLIATRKLILYIEKKYEEYGGKK